MKTIYKKIIEEVFEVKNPKPCPFCGACPDMDFEELEPNTYQVFCPKCESSSGYAATPQMAYALWEMRSKCTCVYCAAVRSFGVDDKDK